MLEQSEKITCLSKYNFNPSAFKKTFIFLFSDKTESAWHETNLIGTKEEGPLVLKQLLKFSGGADSNNANKKRKVEEKYARL